MILSTLAASLLAASLQTSPAPLLRELTADFETGPLRVFRNDGRYGESGRWYQAEEVGQKRTLFLSQRLSLTVGLGERHDLEFLYAPLELKTRFTLDRPFTFRDTTFAAGQVLDHRYLFDGYRATYRYAFLHGSPFEFSAGVVLQIRNAAVEFASADGTQYSVEEDIGFVPALALRLKYTTSSGVYGMFDAVGLSTLGLLSGTDGGVLDAALTLGLPFHEDADLFFRLRAYGGGAEVPSQQITNWGWFGSATAGVRINLAGLGI